MNIKLLLEKSVNGYSLKEEEAYNIFSEIMKGNVSDILLSAFLVSTKKNGECSDEIVGAARALRDFSVHPGREFDFTFVDTCGTGGDGKGSVNVSTLTAITLGSLGVNVAKHGNRAVSSVCGSSDVLQATGYKIDMSTEEAVQKFIDHHFAFLFAPLWHPSMKNAIPVRKELGFRTIFNMIGPLSNPFKAPYQLIGVYSNHLLDVYAKAVEMLGLTAALICHSEDGLDEFSIFAKTRYRLSGKERLEGEQVFDPKDLHIKKLEDGQFYCASMDDAVNAFYSVLKGEPSAALYSVALNAGAVFFLLKKSGSIVEGFNIVLEHLLTGRVMDYYKEIIS